MTNIQTLKVRRYDPSRFAFLQAAAKSLFFNLLLSPKSSSFVLDQSVTLVFRLIDRSLFLLESLTNSPPSLLFEQEELKIW